MEWFEICKYSTYWEFHITTFIYIWRTNRDLRTGTKGQNGEVVTCIPGFWGENKTQKWSKLGCQQTREKDTVPSWIITMWSSHTGLNTTCPLLKYQYPPELFHTALMHLPTLLAPDWIAMPFIDLILHFSCRTGGYHLSQKQLQSCLKLSQK